MIKLCRICRTSDESQKFLKLFDERHDFAQKLFYISSITVFEITQNHPALICEPCSKDLIKAARIKKLAQETDEFFKNLSNSDDLKLLTSIISSDNFKIDSTIIKPDPDGLEEIVENLEFNFPSIKIEPFDEFLPDSPQKLIKLKKHQCKCGKTFEKAKDLKIHKKVHKKEEKKNFSCELCGKVLKTSTQLKNHKARHANVRYVCDFCGRDYANKLDVSKHIRIKHLKSFVVKKPMCHLCGKVLCKPALLRTHMLYSHNGEKNFKCTICDKAFFIKEKLKQHVDALHGERPWICEICSRNFSKRYKLGEHMKQCHKMSLGKLKPFNCNLCGVNYDRKKLLHDHLRDKHEVVVEDN